MIPLLFQHDLPLPCLNQNWLDTMFKKTVYKDSQLFKYVALLIEQHILLATIVRRSYFGWKQSSLGSKLEGGVN